LGDPDKQPARVEQASSAYVEAIKTDDVHMSLCIRLALLASEQRNWREASDMSEHALRLDPVSLLDEYYINALSHLNLNELEIAGKRARQGGGPDFSNQHPQFCLILAIVFAVQQDSPGSIRKRGNYLSLQRILRMPTVCAPVTGKWKKRDMPRECNRPVAGEAIAKAWFLLLPLRAPASRLMTPIPM
jgi:hypothetical protein